VTAEAAGLTSMPREIMEAPKPQAAAEEGGRSLFVPVDRRRVGREKVEGFSVYKCTARAERCLQKWEILKLSSFVI